MVDCNQTKSLPAKRWQWSQVKIVYRGVGRAVRRVVKGEERVVEGLESWLRA